MSGLSLAGIGNIVWNPCQTSAPKIRGMPSLDSSTATPVTSCDVIGIAHVSIHAPPPKNHVCVFVFFLGGVGGLGWAHHRLAELGCNLELERTVMRLLHPGHVCVGGGGAPPIGVRLKFQKETSWMIILRCSSRFAWTPAPL